MNSYKKIFPFLLVFLLLLNGCGAPSATNENDSETVQIPEEFAYTLLVTINPELKLYMDSDNKILAVEYLNADAQSAYSSESIVGLALDSGLAQIVKTAIDKEYLDSGKDVTVAVDEFRNEDLKKEDILASAKVSIQEALTDKSVTANVITKAYAEITEPSPEPTKAPSSEPTEVPTSEPTEAPSPEPCSHCQGTGECAYCNGGKNDCPACNGTGTEVCRNCDEKGMQLCPNRRDCKDGKCSCPMCSGSGSKDCYRCNGSGLDQGIACEICGGTGKTVCDICSGLGYEICRYCGGTGKTVCEICNRRHTWVCTHCKGSGKDSDCPTCLGTLICTYCNGTGKQ